MKSNTSISNKTWRLLIPLLIGFLYAGYAHSVSVDPGVISKQLSSETNQMHNYDNPAPQEPLIIYQNYPRQQPNIIIDQNTRTPHHKK